MAASFYFYDLETSGFNPREARIMQFAGQRTDLQLKPVGEPDNFLIKMTEDIVPDPDAVLLTGITPQKTIAEGLSEVEFLQIFHKQIVTVDTIFVGYNTVRFDDEFMRYLLYRNFYDAYEWQWQDGRSRWDLLDVVRMMRALRPTGIKWPFASDGSPTNRLQSLTSLNGIAHDGAHDALSDVRATISLAQLIRQHQPKLFDYLLTMRDKKLIAKLADSGQPFLYTSGKYSSEWEKTTVVVKLADHPNRGVLVYDLRFDPTPFIKMSTPELIKAWTLKWDEPGLRLPVKTLQFNRCPAVAPLSVLDKGSQKRLNLTLKHLEDNLAKLEQVDLKTPVLKALTAMEKQRQTQFVVDQSDVDSRLYDDFLNNQDRKKLIDFRRATPQDMSSFASKFVDDRLKALIPLYKARNFQNFLNDDERQIWERFRERRLLGGKQQSRLAKYFARLAELAERTDLADQQRYILEELQLYGQSILPENHETQD
ncbi:MAG TPA: exodeoxyribonuclease I [Candidatus Saccharimonadales bacterium]|nr:exodeoxyribonuclease I [Candidatus Saccharimonadales bacterium]